MARGLQILSMGSPIMDVAGSIFVAVQITRRMILPVSHLRFIPVPEALSSS